MTVTVSGVVQDPTGGPVANAEVSFARKDGRIVGQSGAAVAPAVTTVTTAADGSLSVGLEPGDYLLAVTLDGRRVVGAMTVPTGVASIALADALEQAPANIVIARDEAVQARDEAVQARDEAVQARDDAKAAAADAQASATSAAQSATVAQSVVGYAPSLLIDFTSDLYAVAPVAAYTDQGVGPVGVHHDFAAFLASAGVGGTFTRASTATYWTASGTLATAAVDEPRFEHDPATGEALGYLSEPTSTNQIPYSSDLATSWPAISGATITALSATSPAGTLWQELKEDTSTGLHRCLRVNITSLAGGEDVTISFLAKRGAGARNLYFIFYLGGDSIQCVFDFGAGVATASKGGSASVGYTSMKQLPDGSWLCTLSGVPTQSAGTLGGYFALHDGTTYSYAGDGASSVWIDAVQVELLPYATSYIPTAGSAVTRAADSLSLPIGGWFRQGVGSFAIECNIHTPDNNLGSTINTNRIVAVMDSFVDGFAITKFDVSSRVNRLGFASRENAGGSYILLQGTDNDISINSFTKIAVAYSDASVAGITSNRSAVESAVPAEPIARASTMHVMGSTLAGHIKRLAYYPSRVPDATLQTLTMR